MNRRHWFGVAATTLAGTWRLDLSRAAEPEAQTRESVVDKAVNYLKSTQNPKDGSWSEQRSPGVTGIIVTGLLHSGRVTPNDPIAANGLKYIESLVNVKEGHIAGQGPKPQLLNYVTSVNLMALVAANRADKYKKVIGDATKFLKKLQWDEDESKTRDNDFYGGAGYDSKSRPDLSNTQIFLDALVAAGIDKNDAALQKAVVFVSRCQNLKGEYNQAPWAAKINDGSFVYSAANGGQTKADTTADGGLVGYGSMTYAGIKSLIYCGVSQDDERIKKAVEWAKKHYTLDANPGMPHVKAHQGLYYYYHSMAKCLDGLGMREFETADGKKHDWRAEIVQALAKRQKADGSFVNDQQAWMENDPNLVTGYVLMTLGHCKPKK